MPKAISVNVMSLGTNLLLALVFGFIFATTVTNCVVYARGSSSSNKNASSTSTAANGVTTTCSTIMLVLNVILAIGSVLAMVYFFYRVFTSGADRKSHASKLAYLYHTNAPALQSKYAPLPAPPVAEVESS